MSSNHPPVRPGLTAAEFHTAVNDHLGTHLAGPIVGLSDDLNSLQRLIFRSLLDAADFAGRLASGAAAEFVPRLLARVATDAEALFESARNLESKLWKARKAAGLSPRADPCAPGSSAVLALASVLYRATNVALGVAETAAFDDWDSKVDVEGEDAEFASRETALAWESTARRLQDRFTGGFAFPDPDPLFAEMRVELMELAQLVADAEGEQFILDELAPLGKMTYTKVGTRGLAKHCGLDTAAKTIKALDARLSRWRARNKGLFGKEWWLSESGPRTERYSYLLSSVEEVGLGLLPKEGDS